jgi:hypothetical protein
MNFVAALLARFVRRVIVFDGLRRILSEDGAGNRVEPAPSVRCEGALGLVVIFSVRATMICAMRAGCAVSIACAAVALARTVSVTAVVLRGIIILCAGCARLCRDTLALRCSGRRLGVLALCCGGRSQAHSQCSGEKQ